MKKTILAIALAVVLFSCNKKADAADDLQADQKFETYKKQFVNSLWKLYPDWAASQGFHDYDSILIVADAAHRKKELDFVKAHLDSLQQYSVERLSDNNQTDFHIIRNQLESFMFNVNALKSYEWNPSEYNVSGSFAEILNGNYDKLDNRLRNFGLKMRPVAAYYEAAKSNIKNPTKEHTDLAIAQNLGGISVFETDLPAALAKSTLSPAEKQAITEKAKTAVQAIQGYAEFLKKMDNPTPRSFRLGQELYAKKFDYDIQSGYNAKQIYQIALKHKADLHEKMFTLSNKLWAKYMGTLPKPTDKLVLIKHVIDKISLQHTTPEKFQSEIEKQIPELTAYVKAKNLLYIDPSKPLVVRKEPAYMAGVAGASISAPGPYDKNANTYL